MKNTMSVAILAITAFCSDPAQAAKNNYSTQACSVWFRGVDRNNDGSLGRNERAYEFLARVTLGSENDRSDGGFIMSRSFFVRECMIGSLGKPQS